jgi:hypothetical protein
MAACRRSYETARFDIPQVSPGKQRTSRKSMLDVEKYECQSWKEYLKKT